MDARAVMGRAGEDLAAALYRGLGFTVIDRNFRCPGGEIDVVARRDRVVVFCEVKTRRGRRFGAPAEAVTSIKQNRLRRAAARWLSLRRPGDVELRFDVVSVVLAPGEPPHVVHLPGAF